MNTLARRELLRRLAASAAALPFAAHAFLPSLGLANDATAPAGGAPPVPAGNLRRQRLVVIFSPNGTIPHHFWPDEAAGKINKFKPILEPLEPFRDKTLLLRGVANRVRGDGDNHMRGMSCLLTGTELFPGNIQGGSDTPAGWSKGISIDQELKNFLQSRPETRTRFGSLEFGVAVPHRADPWTRMSYAGPNLPVAPIHDPYQMFEKLYGRTEDKESLKVALDALATELQQVTPQLGAEHRPLLEQHLTLVRQTQEELSRDAQQDGAALPHAMPQLEPGVAEDNDTIPKHSRMNIDLLVNALANDFTRVATLQYTNSVSNARMKWLGIEEGHHTLSHEPDSNQSAVDGLTKINHWYAGEVAYLLRRLAEISEPNGGSGTMLDNTLVVWTNELGKGNSHTLDGIPLVLAGGGCGFRLGEAMSFDNVPLNRLWLAVAHAFGHKIDAFGTAQLCEGGPLVLA
jgi:hypothetical protein